MWLTGDTEFESQESLLRSSFIWTAHLIPSTMYSCEILLPLTQTADCRETWSKHQRLAEKPRLCPSQPLMKYFNLAFSWCLAYGHLPSWLLLHMAYLYMQANVLPTGTDTSLMPKYHRGWSIRTYFLIQMENITDLWGSDGNSHSVISSYNQYLSMPPFTKFYDLKTYSKEYLLADPKGIVG